MNFPNLPTDTLYKFLTVFGLIILLTSFLIPIIYFKENDLEKFSLTLKNKNLERSNIWIKNAINTIDSITKQLEKDKRNIIYKYEQRNGGYFYDSSEFKYYVSLTSEKTNFIKQLNTQDDSLSITKQQLSNLYSFEEQVLSYCNKGILYGFVVSLCGFILWFVNNQVYQDLGIKIQGGYRIIPDKATTKKGVQKSDDERYLMSWQNEIYSKILKTILLFIVLLMLLTFILERHFPNGLFHMKYFEIIEHEKIVRTSY